MYTIAIVEDISRDEFYRSFVQKKRPVVIKGVIDKWDALKKWGLDYMAEAGKDLDVNVKTGNIARGNRDTIKMDEYCNLLKKAQQPARENGVSSSLPYLHDIPIFHLLPGLAKDINEFPLKYFPEWYWTKWWNYVQFFMGGKNSLTPLHFDTLYTHNLFFQVVGSKKFILIPGDHKQFCYVYNWRWSPVDPASPDYTSYPLFRQAACMEVVIGAGDILYIPPGMLHQVHGMSFSISFNIDWHTAGSVSKGLLSFLKGAPRANIYYNFLIAMGLFFRIPSKYILPYYKAYLNYVS